MSISTIWEMRKVLEGMSSKYGQWAHLELYEDGSGKIISGDSGVVQNHDELADFDNLPELMEILEIGV